MIWDGDQGVPRRASFRIHDPGIPRIKASAPLHGLVTSQARVTTSFAPATRSSPTEGYLLRVATSKMALD